MSTSDIETEPKYALEQLFYEKKINLDLYAFILKKLEAKNHLILSLFSVLSWSLNEKAILNRFLNLYHQENPSFCYISTESSLHNPKRPAPIVVPYNRELKYYLKCRSDTSIEFNEEDFNWKFQENQAKIIGSMEFQNSFKDEKFAEDEEKNRLENQNVELSELHKNENKNPAMGLEKSGKTERNFNFCGYINKKMKPLQYEEDLLENDDMAMEKRKSLIGTSTSLEGELLKPTSSCSIEGHLNNKLNGKINCFHELKLNMDDLEKALVNRDEIDEFEEVDMDSPEKENIGWKKVIGRGKVKEMEGMEKKMSMEEILEKYDDGTVNDGIVEDGVEENYGQVIGRVV